MQVYVLAASSFDKLLILSHLNFVCTLFQTWTKFVLSLRGLIYVHLYSFDALKNVVGLAFL